MLELRQDVPRISLEKKKKKTILQSLSSQGRRGIRIPSNRELTTPYSNDNDSITVHS